MPQHLSYARILADYAEPGLPFRDTFVLPEHAQPYFTAYFVLAALIRLTSVLTAGRLVYTAYVIATGWAFSSLVHAVHGRDGTTAWTCLFGALLAWNPVQCVGFLPFMLGLPAVLFGAAAVVRVSNDAAPRSMVSLALASSAAASLHFVSAACLVAFAVLHALFRPSKGGAIAAVLAATASLATLAMWRLVGEPGLAAFPFATLREQVAQVSWFEAVVRTFGVQWTPPEAKWEYVAATVLGPLPRLAKVTVAAAIVVLVGVVWSSRRQAPAKRPRLPRTAFGRAVLGFAMLAIVTPSAIQLPDDICLLDFRVYVLLFMFALAFVDPRWFEPARARFAVASFGVAVLLLWARQLRGVASEAEAVLHLESGLAPSDTLLALPFHDRSEYLDEANTVTHYFPVYHTALRGGVTSLFWGKFSHHLPVGYRPGREPPHPPDWDPGGFTRSELLAASHVLVEWPDADDGEVALTGAERLREELALGFAPRGCEGRWCLYRSAVNLVEEARR